MSDLCLTKRIASASAFTACVSVFTESARILAHSPKLRRPHNMKVIIKEWVPVGFWSWDGCDDEVCGICRVPFDGTCPTCLYPGPDCPMVLGACKHRFHKHCISKWLELDNSQGLCPMCRQPFLSNGFEVERIIDQNID